MKKIITATIFICSFLAQKEAEAQVRVDVNIGRPRLPVIPERAPVREVSYYYLPEAEAYYYVPTRRYYYYDDGELVSKAYLPGKYRSRNAYSLRHIAVREPRPYLRHDYYRNRYSVRQANYIYKEKRGKGPSKGKGHKKSHY